MPRHSQPDAESMIRSLGMTPHPEGGWYVETFRAPADPGKRSAVTAIYFLLRKGERSHWHTVDASEIWLWHAGSAMRLHLSASGRKSETILLGNNFEAAERPQAVVPTGVWQAAESVDGWCLASCVVAPAFEFEGFSVAPPGWAPGS